MNETLIAIAVAASALLWTATAVTWAARQGAFVSAWREWAGLPRLRKALSLVALAALVSWAGAKPSGEIIESSNNRIIESAEAAEEDFDAKNAKGNNAKFAKTVGSRVPRDRDDLEGLVGRDVLDAPQDETGAVVEAASSAKGQVGREGRQGLEAEDGLGDFAGGLALVSVGTNEVFDFSAPGGATIAEKWRRRGAAKDYLRLSFANWSFPFGGESSSNLVVFAGGRVRLSRNAELCPFAANLGIVPEARWGSVETDAKRPAALNTEETEEERHGEEGVGVLEEACAPHAEAGAVAETALSLQGLEGQKGREGLEAEEKCLSNHSPPQASTSTFVSLFWHLLTPSNTLVLTWQNALLEREAANPVSFQAELFPSGNVVFRYDLARLGDEGPLTNAVVEVRGEKEVEARGGGGERTVNLLPASLPTEKECLSNNSQPQASTSTFLTRSLTSLFFKTENDLLCDEARAAFDDAMGGLDPLSFPYSSTNTVWEHYVYTGTTNGAFRLPGSTESVAVLRVAVSGSGRGELVVGGRAVPLVGQGGMPAALNKEETEEGRHGGEGDGVSDRINRIDRIETADVEAPQATNECLSNLSPPQASTSTSSSTSTSLLLPVPRGQTTPLYLRADGTLAVSFDSDDFAFGSLPDLAASRLVGRINFPNVTATTPCFHDYAARRTEVTLPVGADADALTCTWSSGSGQVSVENSPPRSARLTGNFDGRATTPVSYTLAHPDYLFGQATFSQTARFCPPPPEEDGEDGDSSARRPYGARDDDKDEDEDDERRVCARCVWDLCEVGCTCCPYCNRSDDEGTERGDGTEEEEAPAPADYESAAANCPRLAGVLKIREPLLFSDAIRLEVPDGDAPRCCPCPDHATNFVAVVYRSSRLKVVDANGLDFTRATETVDVRLAGVSPSREVDDAFLSFATNGVVCREGEYTVLGVDIRGEECDLAVLNALNASFGLPIPVTTNAADAATLALVTDVGLAGGNVHVGFEGASAPFALWVWDAASDGYRRIASSEDGALDVSLAAWRKLVGGATDAASSRTPVRVTAEGPGAADLVFRYWNVIDGKFVEDEARQRITAVASPLRADVNRDGKIDASDAALSRVGRPFRFWTNPSSESRVGGESGRLNLFPLAVDVTPFRRAWGNAASIRLNANGNALRYCALNGVTAENASAVWTDDVRTADGVPLVNAELSPLPSEGLDVGEMSTGEVLAVSAFSDVGFWTSPEIVVLLRDVEVFRSRLPMELHPVRKMYRHFSIRAICGDTRRVDVRTGDPSGLPDGETDGRHFVFVHGYNVGPDAAREWADAMFKRLLLAGSRSMFTSVTWFGDYAQVWDGVPVVGGNSLNYYRNVQHAFLSALPFKSVVDGLPGRKVLLAHSLGNVLVSSAIADHGLANYERYHLLNAAVPMEAYDDEAQTDNMVDSAWGDVTQLRASRWHDLFTPSDFRSGLSWKGRFGVIPRAENCYSVTEDVLANPSAGGMGNSWGIQELLKGTTVLYGTDLLLQNVAVEGGWGINARFVANPLAYIPGLGFRASYFEGYTREQAIAQPLFTSFDDERMTSTNVLDFADAALRAKMLGDAIPAESFAVGSNATDGFVNYEYLEKAKHGWPDSGDRSKWRHSDIKNVAYRYVQDFFKHIKEATE